MGGKQGIKKPCVQTPAARSPPDIRGVLFDLDDTLYNRGLAFHAWATDFVAENLPSLASVERELAVAFLVEADDGGYRPRPRFVATVYRRFPSLPRQSADDFVSDFRVGMLTKIELEAGARSLLGALTARGMPWGIVTNGSTALPAAQDRPPRPDG